MLVGLLGETRRAQVGDQEVRILVGQQMNVRRLSEFHRAAYRHEAVVNMPVPKWPGRCTGAPG